MKNSNSKRKNKSDSSMTENLMPNVSGRSGQVIAAAVIGAAAGAIAGLLLAPSSGRETIDNMSRKANQLKNDLSGSMKEYASMGKEKYEEMVGSASGSSSSSNTSNSSNGSSSNSSSQKSSRASSSSI